MTLKQAIRIVENHNKWRRDNNVPPKTKLDYTANAFIRAYIDEVSRIKKRGTRRQKLAYLFRKKKDITLKDVYALVNKQLN